MIDWNSFWINIYAGGIYFILGILFSIWLIPIFTLKLIRRKNRRFLKSKISFAIVSICDFLNKMPPEFRVNDEVCTIGIQNPKYPDVDDFVAILKPNLFKPTAVEQLYVNILKSISRSESIDRRELMQDELSRVKELRESLEQITGLHSTTLEDKIINEISQLCLEIRMVERNNEFNKTHEHLTGEKEGIHGLNNIKEVYEKAFNLLKNLISQRKYKYKTTTNNGEQSCRK